MARKPQDPFTVALRLLSYRDRTEKELRKGLADRGFADDDIAGVVRRCNEFGYLDDVRFARERASSLLRSGRAVGRRALRDLVDKGVDEEVARNALLAAEEETPPEGTLLDLLERRFPDFGGFRAGDREKRRVIGFLLRRGFPAGMIYKVISDRE